VGTATASIGIQKINWGWAGVSQVFAAWVIAPGIAGCLGALLFLITKFTVLVKPTAVRRAFYSIPFYTFLTVGSVTSESLQNNAGQGGIKLTQAQC
jgi:sodium-dependent phosphate transporter